MVLPSDPAVERQLDVAASSAVLDGVTIDEAFDTYRLELAALESSSGIQDYLELDLPSGEVEYDC